MDEGCIFLKMNLLLSAPGQIRGKKIPSSNPRTISHSSIIRFNFFGKKTRRSLFPFPIKQKDLPMQSQFFISNWTHSALLKPQPNINANKAISRFPWFVPSSQALRSPAASLIVRLRPLGRRSYLTPFNLLMLGFSGKTIEAADRGFECCQIEILGRSAAALSRQFLLDFGPMSALQFRPVRRLNIFCA